MSGQHISVSVYRLPETVAVPLIKMDFVEEEKAILAIEQKFEHFKAFDVYYDQINPKLAEIQKHRDEIKDILSRLELKMDKDEKCRDLIKRAENLEDFLELQVEAVNERNEFLELVQEDCDLNESDEGYFRRTYCSPDTKDDDEY